MVGRPVRRRDPGGRQWHGISVGPWRGRHEGLRRDDARGRAGLAPTRRHATTRHRPRVHRRRSEEHTSELQSRPHLVCRLLLEKKKKIKYLVFYIKKTKNDI